MGRIVFLVEMRESRPPLETVTDSLDCRCRGEGNRAIHVVGQGLAIDRNPLEWRRTGNGEGWTFLPTPPDVISSGRLYATLKDQAVLQALLFPDASTALTLQ